MKRHKSGTPKRKSAKKRNLGKYKSGLEKTCADFGGGSLGGIDGGMVHFGGIDNSNCFF